MKPILCLDFDGVIHSYESGWTGDHTDIADGVTDGFFEWAEEASKTFKLVVYSARSGAPGGREAMKSWLYAKWEEWALTTGTDQNWSLDFVDAKPHSFLQIDDRAMQFTGNWGDFKPQELIQFKPWNKKDAPVGNS